MEESEKIALRTAGALLPTPGEDGKVGLNGEAGPGEGESEAWPRRYLARFVRAGRVLGSDGQPGTIEVLPAALEAAAGQGLFDNRAVFVDHAGLEQGRSLVSLVGVTRQAHFDGEAVTGVIELYRTPLAEAISGLIDQLLEQGASAPDVGLSLVFYPQWASGSPGIPGIPGGDALRQISAIRKVESLDLVFQPAADGRLLQPLGVDLTQSTSIQCKGEAMEMENQPQPVQPGVILNEWLSILAEVSLGQLLNNSGLPQASIERLKARLEPSAELEPAVVRQEIEAERSYLAELSQGQVVQIGGRPPRGAQITQVRSDIDQVSLALEALIQGVRPPDGIPPLSGIREAYHLLSGDYEMSGLFQSERVMFANANSSTMAALVANALNKRLASEFQAYPQWWAPLVTAEDFNSLQEVRWVTLGGVGELPTVAEGAAYTELTWDDKTETASFVKKGGYLGISLEAIDKDDVGRLRAAPRALAQAAWLTLSKAIAGIFSSNSGTGPAMSDGLALFHNTHANLGSTALSIGSFKDARLAMRKQTELNSNERLGALTAPKYLLVPPDLEITALQVLASELDYSYAVSNTPAAPVNPLAEGDSLGARMNAARSRVIVVDLWTDTNDWAAAADPRLYPSIGLGFRYGRAPEIFSVASPTAGLMFSNDTMPIKARFFFAVGPMDWKGLYKANVA